MHVPCHAVYQLAGSPLPKPTVRLVVEPASGPGVVTEERLVHLLDDRLQELSRRIEQSLDLQQRQQATGEAMPRQGPAQSPGPQHHENQHMPGASQQQLSSPYQQQQQPRSTPAQDHTPSPLLLLSLSKADAAERVASELRAGLAALEHAQGRMAEEVHQRVGALQEGRHRHDALYGEVTGKLEAMGAMQTGKYASGHIGETSMYKYVYVYLTALRIQPSMNCQPARSNTVCAYLSGAQLASHFCLFGALAPKYQSRQGYRLSCAACTLAELRSALEQLSSRLQQRDFLEPLMDELNEANAKLAADLQALQRSASSATVEVAKEVRTISAAHASAAAAANAQGAAMAVELREAVSRIQSIELRVQGVSEVQMQQHATQERLQVGHRVEHAWISAGLAVVSGNTETHYVQ